MSVRLKLTLSYAGFLLAVGALLIGVVWVLLVRYLPNVAVIPGGILIRSDLLRTFALAVAYALAFLLVLGLLGAWILAGRMLAPLTRITAATHPAWMVMEALMISERLGHRATSPSSPMRARMAE